MNERPVVYVLGGTQVLYGDAILRRVAEHVQQVCQHLGQQISAVGFRFEGAMKGQDEIAAKLRQANADENCVGVVVWCHTFSPSKMWIRALKLLQKPLLHLHTQFNEGIPFGTLSMADMNEHQSAHGGREFGHGCMRADVRRTIIAGHWQNDNVVRRVDRWARLAVTMAESGNLRIVRWGPRMRNVAVTGGDDVEAAARFGWQLDDWGVGDLVPFVDGAVGNAAERVGDYQQRYDGPQRGATSEDWAKSVRYQAAVQLGMERFLADKGQGARVICTNFEHLHGMAQLPGLAVQDLMRQGHGFAAEGDWKTAALVRLFKIFMAGTKNGVTFMEDYMYHFGAGSTLGAHMLEICPSTIASSMKARIESHPLSIGDREDPARLVFPVAAGPALNIGMVDLGREFMLVANRVQCVGVPETPELPVAAAYWMPEPELSTSAECWIAAGGGHHTALVQGMDSEDLRTFAHMLGCKLILIEGSMHGCLDQYAIQDQVSAWSQGHPI